MKYYSAALILALLTLIQAKVFTVVVTQTASAAPTPTSPSYTNSSALQAAVLSAHNFYRREHNASALVWNDTSAAYAQNWSGGCVFSHSGGPTGENLAAGYQNASAAVDAWGMERLQYDFKKGGFAESTGHFTQLVWKATASVGCGVALCDGAHATPGWFVVCEYYPPGNVEGEYTTEVDKQVSGKENVDSEGFKSAALSARRGVSIIGIVIAFVLNIVL